MARRQDRPRAVLLRHRIVTPSPRPQAASAIASDPRHRPHLLRRERGAREGYSRSGRECGGRDSVWTSRRRRAPGCLRPLESRGCLSGEVGRAVRPDVSTSGFGPPESRIRLPNGLMAFGSGSSSKARVREDAGLSCTSSLGRASMVVTTPSVIRRRGSPGRFGFETRRSTHRPD